MISIIMPVYNITGRRRKFLAAVHSVVHQTHQDWELILVNDGSSDGSLNILNKLQSSDQRIAVINKKNGGVESARRTGLAHARGEFIMHMDQDDLYREDAFEMMQEQIVKEDADVVIANRIRFFYLKQFTFGLCKTPSMQTRKTIEHDEFMKNFYQSFFGINDLPVNIWNKLYRKSFLDSIPEPPLTSSIIEDLSYNMHILPYAKRIAILPETLYYYRWGGYTNGYDKTILKTALTGYRLKMEQIDVWKLPQTFRDTTAIELLNYLNSYFSNLVVYEKMPLIAFVEEANRVLALPDVIEGCEIVRKYDKYHREHIDAMLTNDSHRLYDIETAYRQANRKKLIVKSALLKIWK